MSSPDVRSWALTMPRYAPTGYRGIGGVHVTGLVGPTDVIANEEAWREEQAAAVRSTRFLLVTCTPMLWTMLTCALALVMPRDDMSTGVFYAACGVLVPCFAALSGLFVAGVAGLAKWVRTP